MKISQHIFKQLLKGALSNHQVYSSMYVHENPPRLIFNDCLFAEDIHLNEEIVYPYQLDFFGCRFEKNLRIEYGTFPEISFSGTEFSSGSFTISNGHYAGINFHSGCKVENYFSIHSAEIEKLYISNSTFTNSVSLFDGKYKKVEISGSVSMAHLFFRKGIYELVRINGGKMEGLYFSEGEFKEVLVYGLVEIATVHISSGILRQIYLDAVNLRQLTVKLYEKVKPLQIGHLELSQM
ncbi:MAG: hypothetical protein EOO18_12120, partial [Chryseobacterium sp.]